jgi:hypothetical protein
MRSVMAQGTNAILCNADCAISERELYVQIYGPNLPDLSLIDLPGIVYSIVNPKVIQKTLDITQKYISNPNSIIVLIHNSHEDVHTNRIFDGVRQIDPEWLRTILVMSKADMLDNRQIVNLNESILNLTSHGWFNSGIFVIGGIADGQDESEFLLQSKVGIIRNITGSKIIRDHLVKLLDKHIRSNFSSFNQKVNDNYALNHTLLLSLGKKPEGIHLAYSLTSEFIVRLRDSFFGSSGADGVCEGVLFNDYCATVYQQKLIQSIECIRQCDLNDLNRIMKNMSGFENSFSAIPREIQKHILMKQTKNLATIIEPSIAVIMKAVDLLKTSTLKSVATTIGNYPDYGAYVNNIILGRIVALTKKCREHIIGLIEPCEIFYYSGNLQQDSDPREVLINYLKDTIVPYLKDHIPRMIAYHMFHKLCNTDDFRTLIRQTIESDEENIKSLLVEKPDICRLRLSLENKCKALKKVSLKLSRLPELSSNIIEPDGILCI